MNWRVLNNKKVKRITLIAMIVISAFMSACQPKKMPWQEPELVNDTPPHILDETMAADDITDKTIAEEEETIQYNGGESDNPTVDTDSWNRLDSVGILENKAALANSGNVIEREGYAVFSYMEIQPGKECFFVCPSREIHLVYYDENRQYISGRVSTSIEGEFLEVPDACRYITVSMGKEAVNDSFLVQEGGKVFFVEEGRACASVKKAVEQIESEGIVIIFPGVYKGNIKGWGKDIILYGTDKETCIIENTSSSYYAPPLEIAAGAVKNLTIRAVGTPSSDTSKAGAYAVHVEDNILYNNKLAFENCELYSDFNSAVGMGMRGGCEVEFVYVHMTGLESGLFCHDSAYTKYTGIQKLSLTDCVIEGMKGENAIRFDSQGTPGAEVHLLFINNILVNNRVKNVDNLLYTQNNGGKGTEENWQKLKQFYLDERSTRNNVDALNY